MRFLNIIRVIQLTVPWISIIFLPKKSLKEYFPVSFFAAVLVTGMCWLARLNNWWVVKGGLRYKVLNDTSFIFGPFFVGTLWIFHFTYGHFKRYFIVNLIFDAIFSYPLNFLFQKMKFYRLARFTPHKIFFTFISFSMVIYVFKLAQDRFSK